MSFSLENLSEKTSGFFRKYGTVIIVGAGGLMVLYFLFAKNSNAEENTENYDMVGSADATTAADVNSTLTGFELDYMQKIDELTSQNENLADQLTDTQNAILNSQLKQNDYITKTDKTQKAALEKIISNTTNRGSSSKKSSSAKKTNYYTKYNGKTVSIVNALNNHNINASFSNRKKIAAKNGITNYKGTASQNTALLNKFKQGKLKK